MKWLGRALCLLLLLVAGAAVADPVTAIGVAVSLGTTIAGSAATAGLISATTAALIGAALSIGGALLATLFQKQPAAAQVSVRGRSFETHPPFRIQIGEVPQEGNVVFQKVDGPFYYFSLLISSIPIDGSDVKIWLNDVELDLVGDISDFTGIDGGAYPDTVEPYGNNDSSGTLPTVNRGNATTTKDGQDYTEDAVFWLQTGGKTQFPKDFIDYLSDDLPDIATASWEDCAVLHCRMRWGDPRHVGTLWGGRPIPPKVRIQCKGAKLYDPRLDSTSGVSGASGSHRWSDPDTWAYSYNPAIAWLNMALHSKVLARPQETILAQMVADAADACDVSVETTGATTTLEELFTTDPGVIARVAGEDPGHNVYAYDRGTVSVSGGNLVFEGGITQATAARVGVYLDLVDLGLDPNRTYEFDATSVGGWTAPAPTIFRQVIAQADEAGTASEADQGDYSMPPDARNIAEVADSGWETAVQGGGGLGPVEVKGRYVSWTAYVGPGTGNTAELADNSFVLVDKQTNEKFRCDGVLVVESREWDLLKPIEDSFAATRDSTGGLTGIRAGVYTAPSVTLSDPVASSLEYVGRTDPGADKFIGVYLSRLQDYQESETGSYSIRSGDRQQTIELPFVREQLQAERLVKIFAEREKRNRSVTGVWSGLEYFRRIGEPVTFNTSPLPMMDGTYRVSSQRTIVEPVDGGVRFRTALSLIEEDSAIYDYDHDTDFPNSDYVVYNPPQVVTGPGVPQNVAAVSGNDGAIAINDPATSASDYKAGILLTWTAGTGSIDSYEIQVSTTGGTYFDPIADEDADNTKTISTGEGFARYIPDVKVGATYTIRIRSVGPVGESAWVTVSVVAAAPSDPIGDFDQSDFDPTDFS